MVIIICEIKYKLSRRKNSANDVTPLFKVAWLTIPFLEILSRPLNIQTLKYTVNKQKNVHYCTMLYNIVKI